MKYFNGIDNVADLRAEYVRLIKENHPDNGRDNNIYREIIEEYTKMMEILPDESPKNKNGEARFTRAQMAEFDEKIREKLDEIIHCKGVNIEVVGLWIWLDGDTFAWKDVIKAAGFTWSRNRKKWHYTPYDTGRFYKGKRLDFQDIRNAYGSAKVETKERVEIA